jgi:hypothetical protein
MFEAKTSLPVKGFDFRVSLPTATEYRLLPLFTPSAPYVPMCFKDLKLNKNKNSRHIGLKCQLFSIFVFLRIGLSFFSHLV